MNILNKLNKLLCLVISVILFSSICILGSCSPNKTPDKPPETQNAFVSNFELPATLLQYRLFYSIEVAFNSGTFSTNLDLSSFKNKSKNTYYVSPNGKESNSGLLETEPFNSIAKAYDICAPGDTIILMNGVYKLENWFSTESPHIRKSVNIIGQSDEVYVTTSDKQTYNKVLGFTNVYQTSCSNVLNVLDMADKGNIQKLEEVDSIDDCESVEGSYFCDSEKVYVHMLDQEIPSNENLVINIKTETAPLSVSNLVNNAKIYFENLNILGGQKGNLVATATTSYVPLVMAKNCNFLFAGSLTDLSNAVSMKGTDSIFQGCEASYASQDGFNYHSIFNISCLAIEVGCSAFRNGFGADIPNCNGSSIHEGGKILRVNGEYGENYGGNIIDISEETISVNLGCYSHDSVAGTKDGFDCNYGIQQPGCEMYLYSCKSSGSAYDLYMGPNSFTFVKDLQTSANTYGGTGLISFI